MTYTEFMEDENSVQWEYSFGPFRPDHKPRARCRWIAIVLSAQSFRRCLGRFTAVARPDRPAPSLLRRFADTNCGIVAVLRALSILT
jgi:hypothetical protein